MSWGLEMGGFKNPSNWLRYKKVYEIRVWQFFNPIYLNNINGWVMAYVAHKVDIVMDNTRKNHSNLTLTYPL